jgi:hypothetical protein
MMRRFEGRCHCGNISFVFQWPLDEWVIPVRACGCTFCTRHGGVYTSHPEGRLDAEIENPSAVNRYRFGTRTAEFFVCRRCGVVPFITSSIEETLYAVVNVNTFDAGDTVTFDASRTDFDGETIEGRLERRARTWIPEVRIDTP